MKVTMNNKFYDVLKWIAQYLLPGLATLYFTIASIWNLPYVEEVLGTITAVDTFLGVILGIASKSYNKNKDGTLNIDSSNPEKDVLSFKLGVPIEELSKHKSVTFNVNSKDSTSQK